MGNIFNFHPILIALDGKSLKLIALYSNISIMYKKYFLMTILIAVVTNATAQVDSLIFINDNYIVGEIGSMKKNVLKIETEYSDNDFTIEWDGIKEIYTITNFLVSLANGDKYYGTLKSTENGKIEY